jgi:hypothetical protein
MSQPPKEHYQIEAVKPAQCHRWLVLDRLVGVFHAARGVVLVEKFLVQTAYFWQRWPGAYGAGALQASLP